MAGVVGPLLSTHAHTHKSRILPPSHCQALSLQSRTRQFRTTIALLLVTGYTHCHYIDDLQLHLGAPGFWPPLLLCLTIVTVALQSWAPGHRHCSSVLSGCAIRPSLLLLASSVLVIAVVNLGTLTLRCVHMNTLVAYNLIVKPLLQVTGFYHVSQVGVIQGIPIDDLSVTRPTMTSHETIEVECLHQFGVVPRTSDCRESYIKMT
ncbi:hypothetical protein AHAS_Ahas12G0126700 [Arachis hypogaea]